MTASIPDVDDLRVDELKKLVLQLVGEISALKAENAAQREEIARLKGLPGRPKIRPSGMETATDPNAPEIIRRTARETIRSIEHRSKR